MWVENTMLNFQALFPMQALFKITVLDGKIRDGLDHNIRRHWASYNGKSTQGCLKRFHPELEDYWVWYESTVRGYSDFSEAWWRCEQESHKLFVAQFKPVWYLKGNSVVGRLYRYDTYFEVNGFGSFNLPDTAAIDTTTVHGLLVKEREQLA